MQGQEREREILRRHGLDDEAIDKILDARRHLAVEETTRAGVSETDSEDVADRKFIEVDDEFTRVDDDLECVTSQSPEALPISNRRRPWAKVGLAGAVLAFFYLIFFHRASVTTSGPSISNQRETPGWRELVSCAVATSLDGSRQLILFDDGRAEFSDKLRPENAKSEQTLAHPGAWSFDEHSKRYLLTQDGKTNAYSVLSLDGASTCILVKGELAAANLLESWFSTNDSMYDFD